MASNFWIIKYFFGLEFLVDFLFTTLCSVIIIPALIISYCVTQCSRKSLIRIVKWRDLNYTIVERSGIRSILDNGKNQGIHTLLVQGKSIDEGLSHHLSRLIVARRLLRSILTSKYGLYVWKYLDNFSLSDVLIEAPAYFRGRPVSDMNIQEYVSEVTSKFLPANQPPWQVHTITYSFKGEKRRICLVRAHHVLLQQEHLTLGDFLPLEYLEMASWNTQNCDSPFGNIYSKPSALPMLYQKLTESFSNYWNEFLCNNDPLERPDILNNHIGLFQCLKISVIVIVAVFKRLARDNKATVRLKELVTIVECEAQKRHLRGSTVLQAIFKCFNPLNPLQYFFLGVQIIRYIAVTIIMKIPMFLLRELRALQSKEKHYYPDTLTSWFSFYLPLAIESTIELVTIIIIALGAWRSIFDLCFLNNAQVNKLQNISSCGRKVVSWSDQVDLGLVESISSVTGASHAEILLAATIDSLKFYFQQTGQDVPDQVLATGKYVSQSSLYIKNDSTAAEGLLCISLPTKTRLFDDDLIEILQVIQKNIGNARAKQRAVYALMSLENSMGIFSSTVPSLILKLILNYLTRRYSISIIHVESDLPVNGVDTAVYWSPPQGNCNMSITLHRHDTTVRLGLMADAIISPEHSIITKVFPNRLRHLATTFGVSQTATSSQSSLVNPTTSPGY